MLSISCQKEQVTCRMVLKRAPACSGGMCSLARPTSWAWMFHRASSVCHWDTTNAAARSGVARGKTEVRWDSCSCSSGINSSMVSRASFPACRVSANSQAWSLVSSSVAAIASLTESSQQRMAPEAPHMKVRSSAVAFARLFQTTVCISELAAP